MGLRELLILLLILAIVAVVLRGLYVALHGRRNQLRMALTRNVPDYDLEELELRELPGGGARQVERSFERVMQQNSAYDDAEKAGVGTDIPVLTEAADPEPDFDAAPAQESRAQPGPEPEPEPELRPEPEPEPRPEPESEPGHRRKASTDFGEDEHDALDGQVFVDDYDSEYDDEDYDDDLDGDDDDLDDELDDALNELLDEKNEEDASPPRVSDSSRREPESSRYTDLAADADWLDDDGEQEEDEDSFGEERGTDLEPDVFGEDGYEIEELTLPPEDGPPMDEPRVAAAPARPEPEPDPEPEPEPGPDEAPEPISARDDFDILLDGYEEDRVQRMEELESRQDTASRRFMQWAGERVGRAGGLLRSGPGSSSEDSRSGRAGRSMEQRQERQAEKAARAEQARQEQSELDLFEDESPDSTGPASTPAAETRSDQGRRGSHRKGTSRDEPSAPREEAASSTNNNVDQDYSEVLVVNVMAPADQLIHGDELLPVLLGAGLRFGEMNIFHRHAHGKSGPVLFSVANVLNPGTFDLNEMHDFATRGLCFFLTLPNAINNMQAFEHMLQTARQVCDALDAELKDDYRSVMTVQTIEHYRERIRAFELRQLRQQASRQ